MLVALPCAAQLNYQERAIYLGEDDNLCRCGDQYDRINLAINLDDSEVLNINAGGHTFCDPSTLPYSAAIMPAKIYHYVDPYKQHKIEFNEETRYVYLYGFVIKIIQKTVINSATFYGKNYDCTIRGDGKVQHYGVDY